MIGRLLGGVSTSLLFSIFEAWLIRSHADAQLKNFLGKSFSWAAYSNSIVAILTGLIANKAAESVDMFALKEEFFYFGGYLSPFDMALITSLMTSAAAFLTWEENYGESGDSTEKDEKSKWYDGLRSAYTTMIRSQDILLCGIISSLFEGSMYVSTKANRWLNERKDFFCVVFNFEISPCSFFLFRFSCSCGHLRYNQKFQPMSRKVCLLVSSLQPLWFAAWLVAVCSVFAVTTSREKSWVCLSLPLRLLPWELLLCLKDRLSSSLE